MNTPRLRSRHPADKNRRRQPERSPAWGLPPHPFRYALVATLGVGVGTAILGGIGALGTVLVYLGIAFFLAIAVEPLLQTALRRGVPRWIAVVALALILLLSAAFVGTVIVPAVSAQLATLAEDAIAFVTAIPNQDWFTWLAGVLGGSLDLENLTHSALAFLSDPTQLLNVTGGLLQIGTGIIDAVTGVIIVTVLTVYFAITMPAIKTKAYQLIAYRQRARVQDLAEDILGSVGRFVGGQIVLAILNAIVTFIVTAAAGSPAPALLALIAFVGALIPVVGPVIGASIAALITLDTGLIPAIIVAAILFAYLQVEAYILTPRVMARAVAMPGALVIVAALGGAALGGILGALVAVPIAAAGVTIINRVVIPHQQQQR